jgi:thiosulfate/3-mercaptopyruvate sulfurtransferase
MAEYTNPHALVETDWLEEHVDDPSIRVIEVDEDTTAYEKGHIPGAVRWNWNVDLHVPVGRQYVDQEGLSRLLQQAGVGPDTTVVLYGGNNNWFAAYAYWLLRHLGFGNVKLLNGGRKKWELESRIVTMDVPTYAPTDFTVHGPVNAAIRAFRDEVLDRVAQGNAALVDVRSPEEYRGEKLAPDHLPQEQAQVPGHIPERPTSPGPRRQTRTARSARPMSSGPCTRPRGSPRTRRSSPTAVSESGRRTRGSP